MEAGKRDNAKNMTTPASQFISHIQSFRIVMRKLNEETTSQLSLRPLYVLPLLIFFFIANLQEHLKRVAIERNGFKTTPIVFAILRNREETESGNEYRNHGVLTNFHI